MKTDILNDPIQQNHIMFKDSVIERLSQTGANLML